MSVTARSVLRRHRKMIVQLMISGAISVEAVPWYVEFPEDRAPKKQPEAENTCQEPAPAAESAVPEPLYKRFEPQKPQPAFKGFRSRGTVAEDVRYGFVMAQILDKPRSLKPYDDSF